MFCTWGPRVLRYAWSLQLPHCLPETFVTWCDRLPFCSGLIFYPAEAQCAKLGLPHGTKITSSQLQYACISLQSRTECSLHKISEYLLRIPVWCWLRLQKDIIYLMHAIKHYLASISHKRWVCRVPAFPSWKKIRRALLVNTSWNDCLMDNSIWTEMYTHTYVDVMENSPGLLHCPKL